MLIRTKILASAAVFAFSAGFAVADGHTEMTAETVMASVNGVEITLGQIIMIRSQLPPEYQELADDVLYNNLIDQLIDQQLLGDTLVDEPKRVGIALANEARSLRALATVTAFRAGEVSEERLQAAYDAEFEGREPQKEYNAAHILVDTEEEAIALKDALDGGADFAQTARDNSTGPSGPSGGDLGWFGPGMMVPQFEEAVLALEVGDISDPVETQFGWHIVQLNDQRGTALPTLDDVRGDLQTNILQQDLQTEIADLNASAEIIRPQEGNFDFSVIRNLDLLED